MRRSVRPAIRRGFSVTDMLVVVAIMGILVALLLPAIQAAREAARRNTCAVKMKNLAVALHLFHDNMQKFPSSGFYKDGKNLGDYDISLKKVVPGQGGKEPTRAPYSFLVKLLPYVEQGYIYDQINFRNNEAFDAENAPLTAKLVPVFRCPTSSTPLNSAAKDYAGQIQRPAIGNFKALGATTLAVLQDSTLATAADGGGGAIIPYATYSFNTLKAPTQTVWLCESSEPNYSAWWDGTTASIPGFDPQIDKGTEATKTALRTKLRAGPAATADPLFIAKDQFGGAEPMQFGPSSEHPQGVMHSNGGTESRFIAVDIDPKVYAALITRRADDNGDIGDFFK